MTDRKFTVERWTCAGTRVTDAGKKSTAWMVPDGTYITYTEKSSFVLGGGYDVEVSRDGAHTWRRGRPRYAGSGHVTDEQRARFAVLSAEAEQELARSARERKDKSQDALAGAMEPLVAYAKACRTRSQRAALIADVIDRLTIEAWRTRS